MHLHRGIFKDNVVCNICTQGSLHTISKMGYAINGHQPALQGCLDDFFQRLDLPAPASRVEMWILDYLDDSTLDLAHMSPISRSGD